MKKHFKAIVTLSYSILYLCTFSIKAQTTEDTVTENTTTNEVLITESEAIGYETEIFDCFDIGEELYFDISYGPFTASYASLKVKKGTLHNKEVRHIQGKGTSSRFLGFFFKVKDFYESYIDLDKVTPRRFIRKINEGGHTKDIQIDFNHNKQKAVVYNKKYKRKKTFKTANPNVQDMVSSFYYFRNNVDFSKDTVGDTHQVTMFFDNENYPFKIKYLGTEIVETKLGKFQCMKLRPLVQADKIFKEEESLTLWVTKDKNRIPIRIQADILVGSIRADLSRYKNIKHSLTALIISQKDKKK